MKLEHSVIIAAVPDRVWAVMTDVARWHEWTSTVTSVERVEGDSLAVGAKYRIVQPKLPPAVFTVTAVEPGHSFTWETGNVVVRGVAHHVVDVAPGGSRATVSVRFGGLLGTVMGLPYRKLTREYLALEAQGLKARSELRA